MSNITIFGLNGALAEPTLATLQSEAFAAKVNFPIKVVSRKPKELTSKIQYITSDLTNTAELAKQLKGSNVFIELLAPKKELFDLLEEVSALVKLELFIPSQFGVDVNQVNTYVPDFLAHEPIHSTNLRALGIKTVDIVVGFFSSPLWLHEVVGHAGIDPENKSYDVRGDIKQKFAITDVQDIANTISAVATHSDFKSIPDNLRVFSEYVTAQNVIDVYERSHNVKLKKNHTYTVEESLKEFKSIWTEAHSEDHLLLYLHSIAAQGLDKGASFSENLREIINPKESLWKWSKFDK